MGKKTGKKARVERPDATQGGPRAKVKKERVQPPKSVQRPASAGTSSLVTTLEPIVVADPATQKDPTDKTKSKDKKKSKDSKKLKDSKKSKDSKKLSDEKTSQDKAKSKDEKKSKGKKKSKEKKKPKGDKKSKAETVQAQDSGLVEAAPKAGATKGPKSGAGERTHILREAELLTDEGDDAHGFARLIRAMPGIVALVEQHETAVHRAVFDSYVTAVVEHGVDAADLGPIDIRTAAPRTAEGGAPVAAEARDDESAVRGVESARSVRAGRGRRPSGINSAETVDGPSPASTPPNKRASSSGSGSNGDQVRSPRSTVRASTRARAGQGRASTSQMSSETAADERRGTAPIASRTRAGSRGSAAARSRTARSRARSLEELAEELKPTNNGQRIALAIASIIGDEAEVTAARITAEFERMTWRVPVNVAASVRQAARAGLVDLEGPTGTRLTPAGEEYVAGS